MTEDNRELTYRFFISENIRLLSQNKYLRENLLEILGDIEEDTRTGDEIADEFISMTGIKVVD